jgi:EAL and modified HD-GYP domain-containing signal transduction protein
MQEANFIIREPLLNAKERVLGYQLNWQHSVFTNGKLNEADATELVRFIAGQINETESDSLLGEHLLFLPAPAALLKTDAILQLPPQGTVLSVSSEDMADPDTLAALGILHEKGYAFSLRDVNLAEADKTLLSMVKYLEISVRAADFAAQIQLYRSLGLPSIHMVARNVTTWQQFDFCALLGMDAFVGQLHLTPRQGMSAKELNSNQTMLLQLMDMVRRNADVKELENVLKRDAAVSFKLLRYINSAGFSLGSEIQSLKHAVSLLGYAPLYRWLSLLLATASTNGYSPVLLQTAVIRGRFAELLGQTFLPRGEAENLFVAGMFSLLDRMLGVPMVVLLQKVPLSDAVMAALLSREGIYGPFLALAEACELNSTEIESMATTLCISPKQVNDAHLSALAWAEGLKL